MAGDPALSRDYFDSLSAALVEAGIAQPTLIVDRARLDRNIDTLMRHLPDGMGYRIVAKSLPCLPLIRYIRECTGTDRLMTFNLQMLLQIAHDMPDAHQLLGKPMPVAAARRFYQEAGPEARVQWLVDTPERLAQYIALAKDLAVPLDLVLEVDVGLHRGGFAPDEALKQAVETMEASNHVRFAGLMGYEPHLTKLPEKGGLRERAAESAWEIYARAKALTGCADGPAGQQPLTLNTAGSPTYRLYRDTGLANEVSAGSVLVKPTDFDTDLLVDHLPTSFIATPALKVLDGVNVAGFEFVPGREPDVPDGHAKTVYTFGGNWMAKPVWPDGLVLNDMYGRSSNQQMLTGPADLDLEADDFVFFRPTQSEAVFLQFGDIAVYEDGRIVETWPVFPASA
ncbi:alanine racemase [Henriciella aquimarina]|uniref:alanine racemase n=1 Tax=Henriciella aquimarina TaxID=545261 RepID=UPI000A025146|nr:alanine racemase [Henriciella aquimarina]